MRPAENRPVQEPEPLVYQIVLKGHLGAPWMSWFDGLSITLENDGNTRLSGPVCDQAALHGILKKVRDLGMPLLSVCSAVSKTHLEEIKTEEPDD